MDFDLSTYYPIFIYAVFVFGFAISALTVSHILSPNKKTSVKNMPYESGMDPFGDAKKQFDVKFYLIAILFLVFDVELLFLYPWSVLLHWAGGRVRKLTFYQRRSRLLMMDLATWPCGIWRIS